MNRRKERKERKKKRMQELMREGNHEKNLTFYNRECWSASMFGNTSETTASTTNDIVFSWFSP